MRLNICVCAGMDTKRKQKNVCMCVGQKKGYRYFEAMFNSRFRLSRIRLWFIMLNHIVFDKKNRTIIITKCNIGLQKK